MAYHSETNAVPERFNQTIVTMIHTNLGKLPKAMWELGLASEYSTFINNRIPYSTIQAAPIERAIPSINITKQRKLFRPFGEQVYIHTYQDGKLQDRVQAVRIVGFTPTYRIYKVILPNQRVVTAKNPLPRRIEEPAIIAKYKTNNPVTQTSIEEPAAISTSAQTLASVHTSPPRTPERGAIPGIYPLTGQKPVMPKPATMIPAMLKLVPAPSPTSQKLRELTGAFANDWRQHRNTWLEALAALNIKRQLLSEAARDPSPPPQYTPPQYTSPQYASPQHTRNASPPASL